MLISTKGRYALRIMLELAQGEKGAYVPLPLIAKKQDISEKYLESIVSALVRGGLVEGMRGKGGGYRLNRELKDYSVGEILRLTEGSLAPVSCLEKNADPCPRSGWCRTFSLWQGLDKVIHDYLQSVTIADLMEQGVAGDDYVI